MMLRNAAFFIGIALILQWTLLCFSAQHTIPLQTLEINKPKAQRVGMFALKDTPLGDKHPFIELEFEFSYVNASNVSVNRTDDSLIEVVVFQHTQLENLGVLYASDWLWCCDEGPFMDSACTNRNRLIINNEYGNLNFTHPDELNGSAVSMGNDYFKYNAIFVPRNGSSVMNIRFEPMKTGFWYVYLANCDWDLNMVVNFQGGTSWYNPYGWLPAQSYGDMVVYFVIAGFYGIVLILWIWRLIVNRQDLQLLQHFTTVLLISGLIDMLFWGETYGSYNKRGYFSIPLLGVSIFLLAVQYMWIRLMVLLMAIGYTITRDKLRGFEKAAIGILMILYMVSAGAVQYISLAQLDNNGPTQEWVEPVMTFFEVFFNLIIIIWIITATFRSMRAMREKKIEEKKSLYFRLLIIFIVITIVVAVLFFAETGLDWSGRSDYAMQWQWLFVSIWDWIYFALSCYVAWVWQPTDNNARYAYVPLEDVDDSKHQELEVATEPEFKVQPDQTTSTQTPSAADKIKDKSSSSISASGSESS